MGMGQGGRQSGEAGGAGGCVMERPWHPRRKEGPAWPDPRPFSWFSPLEDILFPEALGGSSLPASQRGTCLVALSGEAARLPLGSLGLSFPLIPESRCIHL